MPQALLTRAFNRLGRYAAIALGFSIPVSTALDNVLLPLVLVCYLASGEYREKLARVRSNPVLLSAVALYGMLLFGVLYIDSGIKEAGQYLVKYVDLLCIPAIAVFFRDHATRHLALRVFAAVLAMIVVMSFLLHFGIAPRWPVFIHDTVYPVVFKHSLTHAVLLGFGSFVFLQLARYAATRRARWIWAVFAVLAIINITYAVPGLTSYVIVGALALYSGYAWRGWNGLGRLVTVSLLGLTLLYSASEMFQDRINRTIHQYAFWKPGTPVSMSDSTGTRLEFYRNTLSIISEHPFVGTGTGSFPRAYADEVKATRMFRTDNPHSEYLLIAAQIGLIGVALLINLFWQQWRLAPRLASPLETHVARGLVLTMAIGCMFNSLLLDHAEGLLYAWLTGLLYAGLQSPSEQ